MRQPPRRRPGLGRRGRPALLVDGTGRRVGKPSIWRLDPESGKTESWALARDIGALALRRNGGAVLALDDGFHFFDFQSGKLETASLVDAGQPRTRLNDGKCDRRGRFFAGGMDDKEELKICGLWRLDPDLSVTLVDDGIICSNGPCWSPDDKTFYFADTFQGEIWAYDYDLATGTPPTSVCSRLSRTIRASPTARPSTRRAACGTRS